MAKTENGKKVGRPTGAVSIMTRKAREEAQRTGLLPHEILLDIARGNPQIIQVPRDQPDGTTLIEESLVGVTMEERKDAAKAAAPYYAPRISAMEITKGLGDDDLDRLIAEFAAQAGIGGIVGGEDPEDPEADGDRGDDAQAPAPGTGRGRRRVDCD